MADEKPNDPRRAEKLVDEDWKRQVEAERERIRAEEAASARTARPGRPPAGAGARAAGFAPPEQPSAPPRRRPERTEAARGGRDGGRPEAEPAEAGPSTAFLPFVSTLAAQAMVALGAIPNPADGRRIFDRAGARYLIDILGALQEKTRGNLTEEEDATLSEALYELRMAYVARTGGAAPGGGAVGPDDEAEPPEET